MAGIHSFYVRAPESAYIAGGQGSNPSDVHLPQFERTGNHTIKCIPITTEIPKEFIDAFKLPERIDDETFERLRQYVKH